MVKLLIIVTGIQYAQHRLEVQSSIWLYVANVITRRLKNNQITVLSTKISSKPVKSSGKEESKGDEKKGRKMKRSSI